MNRVMVKSVRVKEKKKKERTQGAIFLWILWHTVTETAREQEVEATYSTKAAEMER